MDAFTHVGNCLLIVGSGGAMGFCGRVRSYRGPTCHPDTPIKAARERKGSDAAGSRKHLFRPRSCRRELTRGNCGRRVFCLPVLTHISCQLTTQSCFLGGLQEWIGIVSE